MITIRATNINISCAGSENRPRLSLATRSFGLGTASRSRLLARHRSGVRFLDACRAGDMLAAQLNLCG